MTKNMANKKNATIAGVAIAALISTGAVAGFVQPAVVDVDLANGTALGDMATARAAKNDVDFIGCGYRVIEDGSGGVFQLGFCQAQDAALERVTCFTQNPDLITSMRGASDYSFITFSFVDDGAGGFTCTRIGFSTQSFYLPEIKVKE